MFINIRKFTLVINTTVVKFIINTTNINLLMLF